MAVMLRLFGFSTVVIVPFFDTSFVAEEFPYEKTNSAPSKHWHY